MPKIECGDVGSSCERGVETEAGDDVNREVLESAWLLEKSGLDGEYPERMAFGELLEVSEFGSL